MATEIAFSVDMTEFRNKVNFVRNGLGASKTDLQVQLVRMTVKGNLLTLFTANKEMFCSTEVKVTRDGKVDDGNFAVVGAKLEKLIANTAAERATFMVDDQNMEIKLGFLTVNFELYDSAPMKTVETNVQAFLGLEGPSTSRAVLEEAFACSKVCTATNTVRPELGHVELRNQKVLSSDGRKIMLYHYKHFPEAMTLKCPVSTLSDFDGALKNIGAENVSVYETPAYFIVRGNLKEYVVGVRKTERTFPAIEGYVEDVKDPTDDVAVDRNIFESMTKGVAMGLPTDEIKVMVTLSGVGQEAIIEVAANNSLGRKSFERQTVGRKATTNVTFPVSFKHILDVVSVFKGDTIMDMLVLDKKNLMMVIDKTDTRTITTVIPFRTDKAIEAEKAEAAKLAEAKKATEGATPPETKVNMTEVAAEANDIE